MKKTLKIFMSLVMVVVLTTPAYAVSTVNDLVNTESFIEIDEGDGLTNIELHFGDTIANTTQMLEYDVTNNRFEFLDNVHVTGTFETTGDATIGGDLSQSGTSLTLDGDNLGAGADVTITANQGTDPDGILKYNATNDEWEISTDGGVSYSTVATSDLTGTSNDSFALDNDDTGGDVTLYFGNGLAEYIQWDDTNSEFDISDDLNFNHNQAIDLAFQNSGTAPLAPVDGQVYYNTTDDKVYIYDADDTTWNALSYGAVTFPPTSLYFAPQYSDASYSADGSSNVGQLTVEYDGAADENYYRWTTSKTSPQDYDIVLRVQLPQDFVSWDLTDPMQFSYRTSENVSGNNKLDVSLFDTAGSSVALTGGTGLSTANAWLLDQTISHSTGTWTAGGWFTVVIKATSDRITTDYADAGNLILNYIR